MPTFHHHRSFWCDNWQEIYWIFLNHPFIRLLFKSIYFCVSQFSFALLGTSISHQKSLLSRWCSFSPGGLWTRSLEGIHSENLPTLHHFCRQVTQHRSLGSLETNSEMSTTWHKICSCNFIYNYWIYVYVFSYVSCCSCTNCVCPSSCLAGWFWEQWRVAVVGYLKSTDISNHKRKQESFRNVPHEISNVLSTTLGWPLFGREWFGSVLYLNPLSMGIIWSKHSLLIRWLVGVEIFPISMSEFVTWHMTLGLILYGLESIYAWYIIYIYMRVYINVREGM